MSLRLAQRIFEENGMVDTGLLFDFIDNMIWLIVDVCSADVSGGKYGDVVIVTRASVIVWVTGECIRANHGGTRFVN